MKKGALSLALNCLEICLRLKLVLEDKKCGNYEDFNRASEYLLTINFK
jgi:hypothetical protein